MNERKTIALTFDDGPDPVITPQVLDLLDEYNAKASFFLIGEHITPETEHLIRREYESGHEIDHHSLTHQDMTKFTREEIAAETEETTRRIVSVIGEEPKFFRPPFIYYNELMFDTIPYPFICGVGCNDWEPDFPADERAKKMLSSAADGVMFLLHDMKWNDKTVQALKTVMPELAAQGYEFVTLTELFAIHGRKPQPRILYSNVFQDK
jgi:peptidoglycan/xylan/chitin deacetylase (PgdA/CDA1 family)